VTPDSSLEEWFSFDEMVKMIESGRGLAVKCESDEGEVVGMTYAQQESPINGKEGLEKWVIVIAAVKPDVTGGGVGSALLKELERQVKARGAVKMFTYTNKDDEKVVNFYRKNGYEDAGWIRDYQYGRDNSAVFLLKYL
jgi:ribosomal protein S18 acetylase RimI-like enzyme